MCLMLKGLQISCVGNKTKAVGDGERATRRYVEFARSQAPAWECDLRNMSLDVQVFSFFKPPKLARNLTLAVVLWNHAVSARYRKDGVGSSRPRSLPLMCLDEGAKGKRVFTVLASCSNCPAGSSAASICRMQSRNASLLQWSRRLPTVHAGCLSSRRAICSG